jgi:hypothetical protein
MSLWDTANEIEEITHKLSHVRDTVELIADSVDSSPHNGALWVVYAMLDDLQSRMYTQADKVMELHREESTLKKKKK